MKTFAVITPPPFFYSVVDDVVMMNKNNLFMFDFYRNTHCTNIGKLHSQIYNKKKKLRDVGERITF
jgi:hypothetical protein